MQENDQIAYVRAKNDPMTDPKTLTLFSQSAEKSKKIAEEARREYMGHLERGKEEHPILIKNIQSAFKELQKLEWERLCVVSAVLHVFIEQVGRIRHFF